MTVTCTFPTFTNTDSQGTSHKRSNEMDALTDAIVKNREGVDLLASGNVPGCFPVFRRAIHLMKQFIDLVNTNSQVVLRSFAGTHGCSMYNRNSYQLGTTGSALDALQSNLCFIYNRPLTVETNPIVSTKEELISYAIVTTSSIIFNFALAHHQFGVVRGSAASIGHAIGLYNLLLKMLSGINTTSGYGRSLKCIGLNNLSHLHYLQCNFGESNRCLDILYVLIMTADGLEVILNSAELSELMLNLVFLRAPRVAQAA